MSLIHTYTHHQVSAIGELIKAGKVKHWGLSNETTYGAGACAWACAWVWAWAWALVRVDGTARHILDLILSTILCFFAGLALC